MNKKNIIALIVVIVLGVLVWKSTSKKPEPVTETQTQVLQKATANDSTAAIDANLNAVDVNTSIDQDLKGLDQDIKSL
jgi:hypothetical protein